MIRGLFIFECLYFIGKDHKKDLNILIGIETMFVLTVERLSVSVAWPETLLPNSTEYGIKVDKREEINPSKKSRDNHFSRKI